MLFSRLHKLKIVRTLYSPDVPVLKQRVFCPEQIQGFQDQGTREGSCV